LEEQGICQVGGIAGVEMRFIKGEMCIPLKSKLIQYDKCGSGYENLVI
jgi:hypothetical protein